eukprot:841341-Rhodomonas_salina.2
MHKYVMGLSRSIGQARSGAVQRLPRAGKALDLEALSLGLDAERLELWLGAVREDAEVDAVGHQLLVQVRQLRARENLHQLPHTITNVSALLLAPDTAHTQTRHTPNKTLLTRQTSAGSRRKLTASPGTAGTRA